LLRSKYFWLFIGVLFLAIVLLFIDLGRSNSNSRITNTVYPEGKDSVQRKDSTGVVEEHVETENKSKEDVQSCLNLVNRWSNMLTDHNINDSEIIYDFEVHYYTQIWSKEKVIEQIRAFLSINPDFHQEIYNKNIITLPDGTFKCEFDKNTFMNGKNKVYPSYLIMKYNSMGELKIIHESDYETDENIAKKARRK
jgi:hypothetical protein